MKPFDFKSNLQAIYGRFPESEYRPLIGITGNHADENAALRDPYYEQVIKGQTVKDADSIEMMDIALKNKVYDPVVIFAFGKLGSSLFSSAGSNGVQAAGVGEPAKGSDVNYDTLVSLYESRVTAARKALNNYINYITSED